MSEVKWIKIITEIFDDEKILMVESMDNPDSTLVIWFKLLCLAGKQNNSGVFIFNNRIPYTDEMLAAIMRRPLNTVRKALGVFAELGMIEIVENVITIPNWNKYQSLDSYEKKKIRDREYQAQRRENQKKLIEKSSDCQTINRQPSPFQNIEEDKEEDIDNQDIRKELDNLNVSNETLCSTDELRDAPVKSKNDFQAVVEAWNSTGLTPIKGIKNGTTRHTQLKKRINDYGIEEVINAIKSIPQSDFLMGRTKTPFNTTFDWFVKPNNFLKVYEGNYNNNAKRIFGEDSNSYRSAKFLADKIAERLPAAQKPDEKKILQWAAKFADFVVEGNDWSDVMWALDFSQKDDFWQGIILDPDSFIKNYNKIVSAMEDAKFGRKR